MKKLLFITILIVYALTTFGQNNQQNQQNQNNQQNQKNQQNNQQNQWQNQDDQMNQNGQQNNQMNQNDQQNNRMNQNGQQNNQMSQQMKPGTLIEKTFVEIGSVKDIKVMIVSLKNLSTSATEKSIRIQYNAPANMKSDLKSDTKKEDLSAIIILDTAETASILTTFKTLLTTMATTRATYTELSYRCCRGGLEIDANYYVTGEKGWKVLFKLDRFEVPMTSDELNNFSTLLTKGQKIILEKK